MLDPFGYSCIVLSMSQFSFSIEALVTIEVLMEEEEEENVEYGNPEERMENY